MGKRTRLNSALMDNIWLLYQKGVSKTDIVKLLNLSNASVSRVIKAFTDASNGIYVSTDYEFRDCKHIAIYANDKFNLKKSKENGTSEDLQNVLFDILDLLEQIRDTVQKLL